NPYTKFCLQCSVFIAKRQKNSFSHSLRLNAQKQKLKIKNILGVVIMRAYSIQREIVQGRIGNLTDKLEVKLKNIGVEISQHNIYKIMNITDAMLYDDEQASKIMVELQECYDNDNFEKLAINIKEKVRI
ncbi:hypothetical protein, partial [Staphylococcus aureus]|uniref:hypothetical protein n=2 Tax=Staphylococcus aureus TaxID=1280 RepID=UPI001E369871